MMKKAVIVLFLVGIIFSGFLYFLGGQEPVAYQAPNHNTQITNQNSITKKDAVDRDADDLADWEETFWGSDPLKKDTDTDGADDGAEVAVGRSPLVTGPNDKITDPTERLLALTRNAVETKNSLLLSSNSVGKIMPALTLTDLKIKETPTREFIQTYGDQIQTVMSVYNSDTLNEAKLTLEVVDKGKKENVAKIEKINNTYNQVIASLLKLEVPRGAERIQLNLLNSLIRLSEASFKMSLIEQEHELALSAVNKYGADLKNFLSAVDTLNFYFSGQGFAFSKDKKAALTFGL